MRATRKDFGRCSGRRRSETKRVSDAPHGVRKSCPRGAGLWKEVRTTSAGVGSFRLATSETGADNLGDLVKRETVKSSTMKGPQGLAGELGERRCQTANTQRRWVRGRFYVRSFGSVGHDLFPSATRNTGLQVQAKREVTEGGPTNRGHDFRLNSLRN